MAVEGLGRRWGEHVVLAWLFVVLAAIALAFETVAPVPSRREGGDIAVALAASAAGLVCVLVVPRLPARWRHGAVLALVAMSSLLLGVLVLIRSTPQGQASAGYLVALIGLYAAVYLSPREMLAELAITCLMFVLAAWAGPGGLQPFYVGVRVVSLLLVAEVVSRLVQRQDALLAEISGQAAHDPLTGALNRRGGQTEAERVRGVARRGGYETTVNLIDLDGFKGYNDGRGHAAGDDLLVSLVRDWSTTLRVGDVLARVGGDEFVVVLPQTDVESARVLLARMREANPFPWSVGTVVWAPDEDLFAAAARADDLLYAQKLRRRFHAGGPPVVG